MDTSARDLGSANSRTSLWVLGSPPAEVLRKVLERYSFQKKTNRNEYRDASTFIVRHFFSDIMQHTLKVGEQVVALRTAQHFIGAKQACQTQHGIAVHSEVLRSVLERYSFHNKNEPKRITGCFTLHQSSSLLKRFPKRPEGA